MSDQVRQTLHAAAPTRVATPDFDDLWRRGRRRRRAAQAIASVAGLALFVSVGWSIQQMAAPPSLEVVGSPDSGRDAEVQMQADAVWRAPADGAVDAVEKFTAAAFGWSADQLTIEGVTDTPGPMFVTASTGQSDVKVTMLLAAGQDDRWQVFQVQTDGGTGGTLRPDKIEIPVPAGATTMDVHAFVNGRTVHLSGTATATIALNKLGVDDPDMLGGWLVVYRDERGQVVGARGGEFGMGGQQPTKPSRTPPGEDS